MALWHGEVVEARWLTPTLRRVVLGGAGLAGFEPPKATDTYVNLAVRPVEAPYPAVFDPAEVREQHPPETWPARRRYTVRSWDPATGRMAMDFVAHGDSGAAGPWAAAAAPGDVLVFEGPSGGYAPDPLADWHLLVGDESALPSIAAALEALEPGSLAVVLLLCDGPEHEIDLTSRGTPDVTWLHRTGSGADRTLLVEALREVPFPRGRVHAFVHGEADEIREIRRHLLRDRGLDRVQMSCSPYWRRDMTDEAWREVKKDYVLAMESDA